MVMLESPLEDVTSPELVRSAIDAGLRYPGRYWPELAVGWLERGAPMDGDIVKLLDTLADTDHFPQHLRHRAFALARRFEKSGSDG